MIGCISPNIGNCEQTLNTLRYADRVKERNSETGEFLGRVDIAISRPPTTKRLGSLPSSFDSQVSSSVHDSDEDDFDANLETASQADSTVSEMLDDLLSSPPMKQSLSHVSEEGHGGDGRDVGAVDTDRTAARAAATRLVDCHKEAMTRMLEMLKEEMELVNQVDSNHEGLEEYIGRVTELQEEQLSYVVDMREQLLRYHEARNSNLLEASNSPSDDSFEDLRD